VNEFWQYCSPPPLLIVVLLFLFITEKMRETGNLSFGCRSKTLSAIILFRFPFKRDRLHGGRSITSHLAKQEKRRLEKMCTMTENEGEWERRRKQEETRRDV